MINTMTDGMQSDAITTHTETPSVASLTVVDYLKAAEVNNTERSYRNALNHYQFVYRGFLPASGTAVATYLTAYAHQVSVSTLKVRVAALSRWHRLQRFSDPTKDPMVIEVMKGIKKTWNAPPKRAAPLSMQDLTALDAAMRDHLQQLETSGHRSEALGTLRDQALIFLGFSRAFRADELVNLRIEHLKFVVDEEGERLECFLPRSKTDRNAKGNTYSCRSQSHFCPVKAMRAWLDALGETEGPVFRKVSKQGLAGAQPLRPTSLIQILRKQLIRAGYPEEVARTYSSHSLRRGFATWSAQHLVPAHVLMKHVGWKSVESASSYISSDMNLNNFLEPSMPVREQ